MADLYWHCASCGEHEPAQEEYAHGDWEKCECGGAARVMTLKECARLEQQIATGVPREEADRLFVASLSCPMTIRCVPGMPTCASCKESCPTPCATTEGESK